MRTSIKGALLEIKTLAPGTGEELPVRKVEYTQLDGSNGSVTGFFLTNQEAITTAERMIQDEQYCLRLLYLFLEVSDQQIQQWFWSERLILRMIIIQASNDHLLELRVFSEEPKIIRWMKAHERTKLVLESISEMESFTLVRVNYCQSEHELNRIDFSEYLN